MRIGLTDAESPELAEIAVKCDSNTISGFLWLLEGKLNQKQDNKH